MNLVIPDTERLTKAHTRFSASTDELLAREYWKYREEFKASLDELIAATLEAAFQHYRIIRPDSERGDGG